MRHNAWDMFHGAVPILYMVAVLVLTMVAMQPVFAVLSLVGAVAYGFVVAGPFPTLKNLAWRLPLLLIVALANPLFSAAGSTELFRLGTHAFYLESLVYGATSGSMLVAVLAWFSNANRVLDSDQVLLLGARVLPTISLMVSMVMQLIPQFLKRGGQISDAQAACTAAAGDAGSPDSRERKAHLRGAARQASILMSWGMEDSLEMADAMRARGWGSISARTSYQPREIKTADMVLIAIVLILACACGAMLVVATPDFSFYPVIQGLPAWWAYVPFVTLLALPFVLEMREWLVWH